MKHLKTNFLILYSLFLIVASFGLAQNSHAATMGAVSCSREQITTDPPQDSDEISVSSGKCILTPDVGREDEIISGAAKPLGVIEGVQNTLVVACNFTNTVFPVPLSQINDLMFGDTNSVKSLYAEASFGHVSFTGRVIGIYDIP